MVTPTMGSVKMDRVGFDHGKINPSEKPKTADPKINPIHSKMSFHPKGL
jgi:hypothetical protein